jgi:hypothetical protein
MSKRRVFLVNPIGGVARHARNGRGGQSTRQEPEGLPTAVLDGIVGVATAYHSGRARRR